MKHNNVPPYIMMDQKEIINLLDEVFDLKICNNTKLNYNDYDDFYAHLGYNLELSNLLIDLNIQSTSDLIDLLKDTRLPDKAIKLNITDAFEIVQDIKNYSPNIEPFEYLQDLGFKSFLKENSIQDMSALEDYLINELLN